MVSVKAGAWKWVGLAGGQMSALGQKRTCAAHKPMSALPPQADIKADIGFVSYFICSIASLTFLFPSSSHLLISSVIFDCARLSSLIFSQSGGMAFIRLSRRL